MFSRKVRLAGITKIELAKLLGVTKGTIYNWKNDPPKYATAYIELLMDNNRLRPESPPLRKL